MVKRKRVEVQAPSETETVKGKKLQTHSGRAAPGKSKLSSPMSANSLADESPKLKTTSNVALPTSGPLNIQVITGSYERVLHGFAATLPLSRLASNGQSTQVDGPQTDGETTVYTDTFLFAAHSSAIRCLALSHSTENQKRVLATGSTDERINLYNVSSVPPKKNAKSNLPTLSRTSVLENPKNRELGSLLHHARSVTKLQFPTKGKLFSAAEDNTVAISRTRDWTVLSTIKAPIPKPTGRPSGDTAAPGEVPAGVNDFAVHPSMKLMVTVGRGERSMRLWNLVTGKKAGVLNFDRELLQQVGESRYSSGEGRKVLWTEDGEDFVVGFERGAVVFGMDSKPKAIIKPSPVSKIHQMHFLPSTSDKQARDILAVSTEDARILFYDLKTIANPTNGGSGSVTVSGTYPICPATAQLGGPAAGLPGRIKDFELLSIPKSLGNTNTVLCVAASSDGAIRFWNLDTTTLHHDIPASDGNGIKSVTDGTATTLRQVGTLAGTHETGNRITCLAAFVMDDAVDGAQEEEEEDENGVPNNLSEDSASDSD